jgi:hypothetical protein
MSSIRLTATQYIWIAFVIVMGFSFADVVLYGNTPGIDHIIISAILASGAMISTGFVWNWGTVKVEKPDEQAAKSKRSGSRKLDRMLERLSESDREALRDRLNTSEDGAYMLTTDGEVIRRNQ